MGSDDEGDNPKHKVSLSPFCISKYPVTQALWTAVMGYNPSSFTNGNTAEHPVERVSWNDAQDFIEKLNKITNKKYRLPTEAEWEYAARGGSKSRGYKYAGSNNVDQVAWYDDNSNDKTHPVGQKKPNELGIFDMSGNVWEWCNDWYDEDYCKHSANNPQGPQNGTLRVNRGGGWSGDGNYGITCRLADRGCIIPTSTNSHMGFRLVFVP